ncbi:hypothetical protein EAS62_01440 [Bradyrhizobium zhanjiangense]|uniref:Uncharacterized protein n=1 Tax=Bradyrhizobium zhanjiangense TaxID=1325107 RepID=A0ABY0DW06_9BRAD|nr:hypothetical protein EAS62_01440 [Bradyrhizobium zhanjiangense]
MRSLPPCGGGLGRGVSPQWDSPRGESPYPRLRRDLSRKRERLKPARLILRDARLWRALRMRTECAAALSTGTDAD